mmetsp:Transcript_11743/g.24693  ORF Transcript_11743/g.24693 Transcript_11743/m.24693 type:complete len:175 (-) Transcript_11743:1597-2121(-)
MGSIIMYDLGSKPLLSLFSQVKSHPKCLLDELLDLLSSYFSLKKTPRLLNHNTPCFSLLAFISIWLALLNLRDHPIQLTSFGRARMTFSCLGTNTIFLFTLHSELIQTSFQGNAGTECNHFRMTERKTNANVDASIGENARQIDFVQMTGQSNFSWTVSPLKVLGTEIPHFTIG